jgi:hypothetical protein
MLYIIVPGNPPVNRFYQEFLLLFPEGSIIFEYTRTSSKNLLDENIDKLEALVLKHSGEKVHLIGHSIGGELVRVVKERCKNADIKSTYLFPFFGKGNLSAHIMLHITRLLSHMPRLVNFITNKKHYFYRIAPELVDVDKKDLLFAQKLAHHEYDYYSRQDWSKLKFDDSRVFYTDNDRWLPVKIAQELFDQRAVYLSCRHDFVICDSQRKLVCNEIMKDSK